MSPAPFQVSWEQYRKRPFLHIHSSGSTDISKLITLKHGIFLASEAQQHICDNELGRRCGNMRSFVSFSPVHVAGLVYGLAAPIYLDSTVTLPPPKPLTADLCNAVLLNSTAEFVFLPTSLVTGLTENE